MKKTKTKRRHRCNECHELKYDVALVVDPYDEEINNHKVWRWLCNDCERERREDI